MPHSNRHHPTSEHKSTVLTSSSVLVTSVVLANEDDNPNKTCWIQCFIPYMSASALDKVIECRSIGSCSSSGCVQGSWSQVFTFSCYSATPSETHAIIQIKYVLPKLCHLPQYSHGYRDPTTRVLGFALYPDLGTRDLYSYWGRWHSMAIRT